MKQTMVSRRVKWGVGVLVFCLMAVGIWPKQLASQELSHVLPTQLPPIHPDFPNETGDFLNYVSAPQPAPYVRLSAQTITPMPAVQAMMDQVTKAKLRSLIGDLSGEWPALIGGVPYTIATRNTDSGEPINKATQYAFEHMQASGISTQYYPWAIWDLSGNLRYSNRNVIGEITGKTRPDEIYIISAHLDDAPYHSSIAPGADDNASGSAAVLIAAQIMSQYEWNCTLRFALWTGEEQGTYGSQYYAGVAETNHENIKNVINMDMIGWNKVPSPNVNLFTVSQIPQSIQNAEVFSDVVGAYQINLIPAILKDYSMGYRSDNREFWWKNYPAIGVFEEHEYDYNDFYHTANDRLASLDLNYLTNITKAVIGALAHAGNCLASQTPLPVTTPTPSSQPTSLPTNSPTPAPLFAIGGIVWNDQNHDGLMTGNQDIGVPGVTMTLQTTMGQILEETVSAVGGRYSFYNRPSGEYVVGFASPEGYTFTVQNAIYSGNSSSSYRLNSAPAVTTGLTAPFVITGSNGYINAGIVSIFPTPTPTPIPGYSLSGDVWIDKYTTMGLPGYFDMGSFGGGNDPPAYESSVALMSQSGEILQITKTSQYGNYEFTGLTPGTYVISFTPHSGFGFVTKPPWVYSGERTWADPATGATDPITVTSNVGQIGAAIIRLPITTKWLPYGFFLPNTIRDTSANW